jgi:hypothetical protein
VQDFYGTNAEVSFTADPGVEDFLGQTFTAGDDNVILGPVQISTPTNGQKVPAGDLTVTGVANTFEANVVWELKDGSGTVVQHEFTTAAECCKLAPYEFTIKNLEPGNYTIFVHDSDESGEGRPVNQDSKEIVVE